jgi:hypothetical protein
MFLMPGKIFSWRRGAIAQPFIEHELATRIYLLSGMRKAMRQKNSWILA